MTRRVVVTGLGAVSPVGNDVPTIWANLLAGTSGVGHITLFDASGYAVQIAGEVKGFDPTGRNRAQRTTTDGPLHAVLLDCRPGSYPGRWPPDGT